MDYPKLSDLDTSVHPQVATAVKTAYEWAERKKRGESISVIFAGPNGIGKSHIAQSILWSIRYSPDPKMAWELEPTVVVEGHILPLGRFYSAAALIIGMGPTVTDNGQILPPPIDYFVGTAPIIVIDDLGAAISMPYIKGEMQKEEIEIRLFLFIEHCLRRTGFRRVDNDVEVVEDIPSLIITTNLDLGDGSENCELAEYVGPRVWDRLQMMCPKGFMVNMRDVPSYRKKASGR